MSTTDPAINNLLTLCARIRLEPQHHQQLADTAAKLTAWDTVAGKAEAHGLAPLAYTHLRAARISMPDSVKRELQALVLRHRDANRIRTRVLQEILDAFDAAGIQPLVLKGAALAHMIYPAPGLRPMSDIDILVPGTQGGPAQAALAGLGFDAPLTPKNKLLARHHHLPVAGRYVEGLLVSVEIHCDALSHDARVTLNHDNLSREPREFSLAGRPALTLGHVDMMTQLCQHTVEPSRLIRLIWAVDIGGYAAHYIDQIDWEQIRRERPYVMNMLSLLNYWTPLPASLRTHIASPGGKRPPTGVGTGLKPLSQLFRRGRPGRDIWRDLFYPSDWWLRMYYGADMSTPLFWCRWVRHPLHVLGWLMRRLGLYLAGKQQDSHAAISGGSAAG